MLSKEDLYKRKLKKHLYFENKLSCADLSLLTEKSLPFTTRFINELIREGSVVETGLANSTGGRRAQLYSLKADTNYIVSVAVDQFITNVAILDLHNHTVRPTEEIELPLKNNPEATPGLKDFLADFIKRSGIEKSKIIGVGISMPGFVDVKKGINHSFLIPPSGTLEEYLQNALGLPVLIDNDSSLIGLVEYRLGAGRHYKNVMVINIGWGVGLGMILNGELFRGNNGFAGEFSHIPVFKDNHKICSCGKTGCLETETSLISIIEKAKEGIRNGKATILKDAHFENIEDSFEAIVDAALNGDTFAVELFSEAGYNLGLGIAILITLMNPELIVLSGRGAAAGKLWLAPIQQAINEHCIPKIAEDTRVTVSGFHEKVDIIGAAALIMENYDSLPALSINRNIIKTI
ncbi:MAG: ROK family protein [Chitinophagaceae bacterium]|nr:ROK family protein [Chitinophagaceae bacterium]